MPTAFWQRSSRFSCDQTSGWQITIVTFIWQIASTKSLRSGPSFGALIASRMRKTESRVGLEAGAGFRGARRSGGSIGGRLR